ncbi:MAG TPA: acyltransferase [Vicinamibacterales bacterium]|nr:acyltransferase [Vicinamibacterales bacterium]
MITSSTAIAAPRLWTIDALRGFAALAVVLCHAIAGQRPGDTLLGAFAYKALSFGRFGVWLFFVISGFCIHYRWALRARSGSTAPPEFVGFWRRRIRRLYPPYLVALAVFVWLRFGTAWVSSDVLPLIGLHLLMLQNVSQSTVTGINEVFWTLATEEQLYLLYFVLVRLRAAAGWPMVLAAGVLARLSWFVFAGAMHRLGHVDVLVTQAAAAQWPIWMLGALSVEAMVGLVEVPRFFRSASACVVLLAAAAVLSYGLLYTLSPGLVYRAVWFTADLCWGLGFFVAVNLSVARQRLERRPSRIAGALAAVGVFSYSLYLTHEVVTTYAWRVASGPALSRLPALAVAVMVIASLGFARVFFRLFERPFLSVTSRAIRPAIAV